MTEVERIKQLIELGHFDFFGLGTDVRAAEEALAAAARIDPACPVCRDTGIVISPDPDRESVFESACPERVHDNPRDIGARRAAELSAKTDDENWLGI